MRLCRDEGTLDGDFETNMFTKRLLLVLGLLVRYGKFTKQHDGGFTTYGTKELNINKADSKVMELIPILMTMLETGVDTCTSKTSLTAPAIEAKAWILDTLWCILDHQANQNMHQLFTVYDQEFESAYSKHLDAANGTPRSLWDEKKISQLVEQLFRDSPLQKVFSRAYTVGNPTLEAGETPENDDATFVPDYFTTVLLGLTKYDDTKLKIKAFRMLIRHLGTKEALTSQMGQVCLTNSPSIIAGNQQGTWPSESHT